MIKERILQIAKRKGITNREICQKIGLTYGGFTGENKKRPVNSDAIANLLVEYPDVNPRWLLTDQGAMLHEQSAPEVAPTIGTGLPRLHRRYKVSIRQSRPLRS